MEYLAPPLECLLYLRASLENGESIRSGVTRYCQKSSQAFSKDVRQLLVALDSGTEVTPLIQVQKSAYRQSIMTVMVAGLQGHSIYDRLESLQEELISVSRDELQKKIDCLPFQMMVPLLLFQFPAFLLLLMGPILQDFLRGLQ